MVFQILLHTSLLFWSFSSALLAADRDQKPPIAKPNCQQECGGLEVPYPFGMETPGCYLSDSFQIYCDDYTDPQAAKPFLSLPAYGAAVEVLEISLAAGTLKVANPISFFNCSNKEMSTLQMTSLKGTPYLFSQSNRFTSISCGAIAYMISGEGPIISGCLSICDPYAGSTSLLYNSCTGIHCCQTTIPRALDSYLTTFGAVEIAMEKDMCKSAFLVDQDWFTSNTTNISAINEMDSVPIVLDWDLSNYTIFKILGIYRWWHIDYYNRTHCTASQYCSCLEGFEGNPYLLEKILQTVSHL